MAKEVSEYHRRQGFEALHHEERQFEEAATSHRSEEERLLLAETARVPTLTTRQMKDRFHSFFFFKKREFDAPS